jgi:GNAT superfamily N-acetyltransferase
MNAGDPIELRPLTADDHGHITWALHAALAWDPEGRPPSFDVVLNHPELTRYHEGWGRFGDIGVVAESDGVFAGIAFCRLFTEGDHGYGYLNDETPELAVAVREEWRRRGVGTLLMNGLAAAVRRVGIGGLSLSVNVANPARRLYERLGYREVTVDAEGVRMFLDLREASRE